MIHEIQNQFNLQTRDQDQDHQHHRTCRINSNWTGPHLLQPRGPPPLHSDFSTIGFIFYFCWTPLVRGGCVRSLTPGGRLSSFLFLFKQELTSVLRPGDSSRYRTTRFNWNSSSSFLLLKISYTFVILCPWCLGDKITKTNCPYNLSGQSSTVLV